MLLRSVAYSFRFVPKVFPMRFMQTYTAETQLKQTVPALLSKLEEPERQRIPIYELEALDSFLSKYKFTVKRNPECMNIVSDVFAKLPDGLKRIKKEEDLINGMALMAGLSSFLRRTFSESQILSLMDCIPPVRPGILRNTPLLLLQKIAHLPIEGPKDQIIERISRFIEEYMLIDQNSTSAFCGIITFLDVWITLDYYNQEMFDEFAKNIMDSVELYLLNPNNTETILTCAMKDPVLNESLILFLFSRAAAILPEFEAGQLATLVEILTNVRTMRMLSLKDYVATRMLLEQTVKKMRKMSLMIPAKAFTRMLIALINYLRLPLLYPTAEKNMDDLDWRIGLLALLIERFLNDSYLTKIEKWEPCTLFDLLKAITDRFVPEELENRVCKVACNAIDIWSTENLSAFAKYLEELKALRSYPKIHKALLARLRNCENKLGIEYKEKSVSPLI